MIKSSFQSSLSAGCRCECSCGHQTSPVYLWYCGKNLHFPVQVRRVQYFSYTSKHQTFTISCIITDKQRAPIPSFVIHFSTLYLDLFYISLNYIFMLVTLISPGRCPGLCWWYAWRDPVASNCPDGADKW